MKILYFIILITLGLCFGVYQAANAGHGEYTLKTSQKHPTREVENETKIPQIEWLKIVKDQKKGWNLSIHVSRFKFTPNHVNQKHKTGEGHAHLYVNGIKIARMYSPYYHISNLPLIDNEISVVLNSNAHEILKNQNIIISKTILIRKEESDTSCN